MKTQPITVGSLFSGIGGIDLGLERAGMEVKWQVESNPWCNKILAKHWPKVKRYGDIKNVKGEELESVDLVCGGFPCQPASQAGKRKGQSDERWLWPEFYRIIREVRPRWVLAENVPGLLSVNAGSAFGEVVGDLAQSGYCVEWDCISAAAVGAPHLRERIWIVAHTDHTREGTPEPKDNRKKTQRTQPQPSRYSTNIPNTKSKRLERQRRSGENSIFNGTGQNITAFRSNSGKEQWELEPAVGRVVDGVPKRVDRLRGLGNAVVPQIIEWIGERIKNNTKNNQMHQ